MTEHMIKLREHLVRIRPHDKIIVKKQLCSSPKEETSDFIWSYVKHSIILLAVAYFEKQSGQIQIFTK